MTKEKNKKNKFSFKKAILFLGVLFLFFSFGVGKVLAEDKIDVEYLSGEDVDGDDLFDYSNIMPGWEESKTIRVQNESLTDNTNLYFTFDIEGDKTLAEKLKLYVIRVADNNYRIGGADDRWTLEEADGEGLYVDRLSTRESELYKIRIKFDTDAGNEFQGKKANFDIDFTIESSEATAGLTEAAILASQGRIVSGAPPQEEVQGVETISEENAGEAAGEEATCQSWPKWVWILSLIVFALALAEYLRRKYVEKKLAWKAPAVWVAVAMIFWHYGDKCREFTWIWKVELLLAIIIYAIYLYFLKNKIKQNNTPPSDFSENSSGDKLSES